MEFIHKIKNFYGPFRQTLMHKRCRPDSEFEFDFETKAEYKKEMSAKLEALSELLTLHLATPKQRGFNRIQSLKEDAPKSDEEDEQRPAEDWEHRWNPIDDEEAEEIKNLWKNQPNTPDRIVVYAAFPQNNHILIKVRAFFKFSLLSNISPPGKNCFFPCLHAVLFLSLMLILFVPQNLSF